MNALCGRGGKHHRNYPLAAQMDRHREVLISNLFIFVPQTPRDKSPDPRDEDEDGNNTNKGSTAAHLLLTTAGLCPPSTCLCIVLQKLRAVGRHVTELSLIGGGVWGTETRRLVKGPGGGASNDGCSIESGELDCRSIGIDGQFIVECIS